MAAITYLASMVLMLLLVLLVAAAVVRGRHWEGYEPTFTRESGVTGRLASLAGNETVWIVAFLVGVLALGGGAVLFVGGSIVGDSAVPASVSSAAGVMVVALAGLLLVGYLFSGTYYAARARGLQRAAAVMAGSWSLGLLAIFAVALKLVTA